MRSSERDSSLMQALLLREGASSSGYALLYRACREPHQPGKISGFDSPNLGRREGALPRHQDQGTAPQELICARHARLCGCFLSGTGQHSKVWRLDFMIKLYGGVSAAKDSCQQTRGLIFHSTFIGRAQQKNKGRISRPGHTCYDV